jgi:hypothetical protein
VDPPKPSARPTIGESRVTTRILGTILIIVGVLLLGVLLSSKQPIIPHILGPIFFATVGIVLLVLQRG